MHINIEMTLRFSMTPTTPIVNSTAESARYHESCGSIESTLNVFLFCVGRSCDTQNSFNFICRARLNWGRILTRARIQNVFGQDLMTRYNDGSR